MIWSAFEGGLVDYQHVAYFQQDQLDVHVLQGIHSQDALVRNINNPNVMVGFEATNCIFNSPQPLVGAVKQLNPG